MYDKKNKPIDKVTAFITRQGATQRELLVFDHPTAGVQVPAGTVEEDEPILDAVCREVYEEAGLTCVRLMCKLATINIDLPAPIYALLQDTPIYSTPSLSAELVDLGFEPGRGLYLRLNREQDGWAHVTFRDEDLNADPPVLLVEKMGWVPSELLTSRLIRHSFHMTPFEETPETWERASDGGHSFRLYWAPLSPFPALMAPQDEWLNLVYEQLFSPFPEANLDD